MSISNFGLTKSMSTVNRKKSSKIFHDLMNDKIYSPHPRTNDGEHFLKIDKHSAPSNASNDLTKGQFEKLKTRLHDLYICDLFPHSFVYR
jgi:hypothetical protein